MMLNFDALNREIAQPDLAAEAAARAHWDGIAKPLKGLGHFEEMVVRIAALTGKPTG